MASQTKDQQVKEVTQALALGLLLLDVESVPSGRQALSMSFSRAWRDWPKAYLYPSFAKATFPGDLFLRGTTKSAGRQAFAAWNLGRRAEPHLLAQGLDPQDYLEILCEDGPCEVSDWLELGRGFIEAIGPDDVQIASD